MTMTPKTLIVSAGVLAAALVVVGGLLGGVQFAAGLATCGGLMLLNLVAWVVAAPVLDILIYQEPVNLVFTQGITAAIMNIVSAGVFGTLLLVAYAATRTKKGSLSKAK